MDRLHAVGVNAPQIEYWNGPVGDKWARLADSQDAMLEALGLAAMDACGIQAGHMVLDVGCGSGTTTIEIGRRVGSEGSTLGVDISAPMLDIGRARLKARSVQGVTFENKDVADYPFEADTFDRVFSRFGVMFFLDPVAAFANIRGGMKSGGRLAFVCWQALSKNAWFEVPLSVALRHLPPLPPRRPEEPGPTAFADPERVRKILSGAGFVDIGLEAHETMLRLEADIPAAVEKLLQIGPTSRLLKDAPEDVKARVTADLEEAIADCRTDSGVKMGCAAWIVKATAP